MNIEAIRTLLVTAEHRNYRKVAEVMHISQPAISKRIRVLEDHFGNSLVERVGASMVLTPAGQALLPYFERIVATFDEASQRLIEPENWRGSIRLGAVDTILSTWLTDFLDQHRKRHPKIKFEVVTAPTHELLEDIKQGRIDIALMLGPSYDRALMEVPLCVMDVGFYGKRNEQSVKREGPRRLTISEVSELTIITFPNGSRPYFEIVEKLRALRLPKMPV